MLEELLETSKPPWPADTAGLHYLLKTPLRYPPLPWGSRFGRVFEPGVFYAGASVDATLAEAAYYRLVFLLSMEGEAPKRALNSGHTLFTWNPGFARQPPRGVTFKAVGHASPVSFAAERYRVEACFPMPA